MREKINKSVKIIFTIKLLAVSHDLARYLVIYKTQISPSAVDNLQLQRLSTISWSKLSYDFN